MKPGSRDEPYDGHIFRIFEPSEFQCPKEERFRPPVWEELCPLSGVLLATFTQMSAKARKIYVTKGKEETGNLSGCWFLGCSLLHVHCQSYFSPPLILGCLIMKLSQFYTPLLLETSSFVISLTAQPEHKQRLFYVPLLFSVPEQVLEQMPEPNSPGDRGTMYSMIQCKVPSSLFNPSYTGLHDFLTLT